MVRIAILIACLATPVHAQDRKDSYNQAGDQARQCVLGAGIQAAGEREQARNTKDKKKKKKLNEQAALHEQQANACLEILGWALLGAAIAGGIAGAAAAAGGGGGDDLKPPPSTFQETPMPEEPLDLYEDPAAGGANELAQSDQVVDLSDPLVLEAILNSQDR